MSVDPSPIAEGYKWIADKLWMVTAALFAWIKWDHGKIRSEARKQEEITEARLIEIQKRQSDHELMVAKTYAPTNVMDKRFDRLENKIDAGFDKLDKKLDQKADK